MFLYSQNDLYCEQVPLADLAARTGTLDAALEKLFGPAGRWAPSKR